MIGEIIGNYRVTGMLGAGGMGEVYMVEHLLIGRRAALKVLLPELSQNRVIVSRFFNEARAASAVRHPGIVEILDSGYHADGRAFILMEHLDGETLHTRQGRMGVLPLDMALHFTRQIAGALAAAHGAGIVHRDLKPENLFIVADPEVAGGERIKLLDFGIAKLVGDVGVSFKTLTGMVMGTPAYMAPEQCKGAGLVDHRADLYALGCLLFQLLCGRPPFVAEGGGEVLAQHIYASPPRPSFVVSGLPVEVEALILELLAKAPEARPQSAQAVVDALDPLLIEYGAGRMPTHPPGVRPSGRVRAASSPTTLSAGAGALTLSEARPRSRWRPIVPVATIFVGLAAGGLYAMLGQSRDEEPAAQGSLAVAASRGADAPALNSVALAEPDRAPSDLAAPEPLAAAEPAAPLAAPVSSVRIESEPRAEVLEHGRSIGRTPLTVEVPAGEERAYVLRCDGYAEATVRVPAEVDARAPVTVALERESRGVAAPSSRDRARTRRSRVPRAAGQPGAAQPSPTGDLSQGGSLPF